MTSRFSTPRQILDAFAERQNAGDAVAFGELFAEESKFVNSLGMRFHGRPAIIERHTWAFRGHLVGNRIVFDEVDELQITDDVVALYAHCVRERLPDAPEGSLPAGASVLVLTTRRTAEGWEAIGAAHVQDSPTKSGPGS